MNSSPGTRIHPASYCSLRIEMRCGERSVSVGTGFIVCSPVGHLLITSRQNVTRVEPSNARMPTRSNAAARRDAQAPDRIVIWHHLAHKPGHWRPVTQALRDRDGKPLWIEHPVHGAKADFVALRLLERAVGALDCWRRGNTDPPTPK